MKQLSIIFIFLLSMAGNVYADKTEEIVGKNKGQVVVKINKELSELNICFDESLKDAHSVISTDRLNDLYYKTLVMRYFGGLYASKSLNLKTLIISYGDDKVEYEFNRENLNHIVHLMIDASN